MLYKSSWHFSLGIILLTIISHNVRSNEQNEIDVRRNIFNDIKNFFDRIFKPRPYPQKQPPKANVTDKKKIVPIKITVKKVPQSKSAFYVLRRILKTDLKNKNDRLQSDRKDIPKGLAITEVDLKTQPNLRSLQSFFDWLGQFLNLTYDEEDKRYDYSSEDKYMENKRRQNADDLKPLIILVTNNKRNIIREIAINKIDTLLKQSLRSMHFFFEWLGKFFNVSVKANKSRRNEYITIDDNNIIHIRRQNGQRKPFIILVTKNKKAYKDIGRDRLLYSGLNKSVKEDDLKQTLLRQAFGDACIKVAIRKCYKALRRVNEIVCKTLYKCKSSFKSMFLLKAKRACIKSFDFTGIYKKKRKEKTKFSTVPVRTLADRKREKYIDACIPYMLPKNSYRVRNEIPLGNLSKLVKQILRGKSDRKCQKFSRQSCVTACNSAQRKVCSIYTCGRGKKKAFKRECKSECKRSYAINGDSSDSSKSSSSGD